MRLISNFKDYYDSLQDPTDRDHVYVRMPVFLKPDDFVSACLRGFLLQVPSCLKWRHDRLLGQDEADRVTREWNNTIVPQLAMKSDPYRSGITNTPDAVFATELILFCGKLYRGVRYTERWNGIRGTSRASTRGAYWKITDSTIVSRVWWSLESFEADTRVGVGRGKFLPDSVAKDLKVFLENAFLMKESNTLLDLHFKTGCPAISTDWDPDESDRHRQQLVAVLNPCLDNMQFYRVMTPPMAYQELSMFIGGVLSNNDRPEPIDNKYKIMAHGFDLKDSFRKGPTKTHR